MADQAAGGLLSPWLRRQRMTAAAPWIRGRVLDFGCGAGALAADVEADRYVGLDRDAESLRLARLRFPQHRFVDALDPGEARFDTVVSLAVIEHVSDPAAFLKGLAQHLANGPDSRIVISTPHPAVDWVHTCGASVGLFSKEANEEHEQLLDRRRLQALCAPAGVTMLRYGRFLFGANQLAVFTKASA